MRLAPDPQRHTAAAYWCGMKAKVLAGVEGRPALYALAAATGEVVFALEGEREELRALAEEGARRSAAANHRPS